MKNLALAVLIAVGILATSTLDAAPAPDLRVVAQTENFIYFAKRGKPADAKRCQLFLEQISKLLNQPVDGRAAYYVHDRQEDVAAATGFSAFVPAGVTASSTGEIHTVLAFHPHEIVHRVALQLGNPGVFFQEGLAVALGDEGQVMGVSADKQARATVLRFKMKTLVNEFTSFAPETSYPLAGSFVGYLIRTYGVDRVAGFFKACGSNPDERDRQFWKVFGLSLDSAGAAWAAALQS